jgi:hypothetical protein
MLENGSASPRSQMEPATLTYENVVTKQLVEDWADDKGFVASNLICLHLEERFGVTTIHVVAAVDQVDFLLLQLTTERWPEPREFGLLSSGSLTW